jgi:alkanesulfonate monooxygenase SsuD/methylene tetrahydromethanopterin reductase-like flavin-dependent oxidoreductase (luciferase family)
VHADVDTTQAIRDYVELNVEAEALGFESSFLVEHHFSGWNQVAATLMLQTCVATRTSTLRLETGVLVLPWHNPVLLAEQAATLDVISGGRVDLGVGKGYRHSEFRGFNVDQADADARFGEALDVLLRAWTTRHRFSHHGRYWDFDDIVVEPLPLQSPHPPIWVAAASEASVRLAARQGHGLLLDQYASVGQIAERIGWFGPARSRWPARSTSPTAGPKPRRPWRARPRSPAAPSTSPAHPAPTAARTCWATPTPRSTPCSAPRTRSGTVSPH